RGLEVFGGEPGQHLSLVRRRDGGGKDVLVQRRQGQRTGSDDGSLVRLGGAGDGLELGGGGVVEQGGDTVDGEQTDHLGPCRLGVAVRVGVNHDEAARGGVGFVLVDVLRRQVERLASTLALGLVGTAQRRDVADRHRLDRPARRTARPQQSRQRQ